MSVRVKVCGNTRLEDAMTAVECGAEALGFIFWAPSSRAADPEVVAKIVRRLPPLVTTVAVFVNEAVETMNRIVAYCRLDRVQLHGQEPHELLERLDRPAYRAFKPRSEAELEAVLAAPDGTLLLDTFDPDLPGGTGRPSNWAWARRAGETKRVILAGGLDAGNVASAVEAARPWAVDVASSLESRPGIKDAHKIEAFFQALKDGPLPPTLTSDEHASAN